MGSGPVGADIACRDLQTAWPEPRPFVDDTALAVAEDLGLPTAPDRLAELQELAREAGIRGRSRMRRAELVAALSP